MATSDAGDEVAAQPIKQRLTFVDLPTETQREIISHCSQSDLICLALVSRHFHELASAQLYRNFHIIFPDDDDLNFDSPIDGLAGGLDTFTTSNYDYAKHLRDLSMDTLSAGLKGECCYQSYLYSASCGKPVYRELHRIASLKKLHVRMQAGDSYYVQPPPLPVSIDPHPQPDSTTHWGGIPPLAPLSLLPPPPPPPGVVPPVVSGPPPALLPPSSKSAPKNKAGKRVTGAKEPSTFSGFKNLQSLSVLDIENLDIVSELNACIKNSSSTLTELQLSFSDGLASRSRRPPPDSDADDSDVEDEFQVLPAAQNNNGGFDSKQFRVYEERRLQESVLGRIFQLFPPGPGAPRKAAAIVESDQEEDKKESEVSATDVREAFIESIKNASTKLMTITSGSSNFSATAQDMLDTIAKAARNYVDSVEASALTSGQPNPPNQEAATSTANGVAEGSSSKANEATISGESPSSKAPKRNGSDASPEDIDIAHIEVIDDVFGETEDSNLPDGSDPKPVEGDTSEAEPGQLGSSSGSATPTPGVSTAVAPSKTTENAAQPSAHKVNLENLMTKLDYFRNQSETIGKKINELHAQGSAIDHSQIKDADAQLRSFSAMVTDLQNEIQVIEEEMDESERRAAGVNTSSMSDYVRRTRGLMLTSLSIYLVPVKASVLSQTINLSCLKQLTLLNVGDQAAIWSFFTKANKVRPLPLRSIFTDHVSNQFLVFASQLEEIHDLFLLERSPKNKPETTSLPTFTTMEQIRRLVLKKHIGKLKRLMIKDEASGTRWDCNEKTMILICTQGRNLEELALSMNIQAVHIFMQYFSGLISLRAINILHFRNNDTCIWVVREILRFIVDNLSHYPELKLEWIAMEDDRVDRVIRPSDETNDTPDERKNNKRAKGKSKDKVPAATNLGPHNMFPPLPLDSLDSESDSDDEFNGGSRLRFKTVGPLQFYDVWGVKIFDKEIRSGRL
ncbi:uncharacterized protein TRIVIDRAFT_48522 [Trichoderma virens Gv29-8]|uniref:F-box domain-containing protein n=1 Tax=Hypocrea virens (strain Gv29-8 / FGSC 10586) TaxID=413071 RepID=G9MZ45_HYPVG|nr:uncharacterized protein TRIVIDRAFT_48522 [Trichoderma virens Gv29-8]EHK20372.1 hypothetical protein TRIVIDRAFT_48522 [Trichoderma virens Gv29-8]UKZ47033.1 hypothetical protein TrVGV298_001245 [Trichoderma virens]